MNVLFAIWIDLKNQRKELSGKYICCQRCLEIKEIILPILTWNWTQKGLEEKLEMEIDSYTFKQKWKYYLFIVWVTFTLSLNFRVFFSPLKMYSLYQDNVINGA